MENIQEFMSAIEDNLYSLQEYNLSCIYKDICLKNYKYNPSLDSCNQVVPEWKHSYKEETLTVDIIRQILTHDVFELVSEKQNQYLSESQDYEANDENHEKFQRKIKKIAEICIWIQKGLLFKEFIDNYRFGYFN
jgi:hypothetical protein